MALSVYFTVKNIQVKPFSQWGLSSVLAIGSQTVWIIILSFIFHFSRLWWGPLASQSHPFPYTDGCLNKLYRWSVWHRNMGQNAEGSQSTCSHCHRLDPNFIPVNRPSALSFDLYHALRHSIRLTKATS